MDTVTEGAWNGWGSYVCRNLNVFRRIQRYASRYGHRCAYVCCAMVSIMRINREIMGILLVHGYVNVASYSTNYRTAVSIVPLQLTTFVTHRLRIKQFKSQTWNIYIYRHTL